MHFTEKKGQRLAVFDHLTSPETGQHIEIPITSAEMEASMLETVDAIGRRGPIFGPQGPVETSLPKNHTTG